MLSLRRISDQAFLARLACVRHAASVHPEPGSNSLKNSIVSSLPAEYDQVCLFRLIRTFCVLLLVFLNTGIFVFRNLCTRTSLRMSYQSVADCFVQVRDQLNDLFDSISTL